MATVPGHATEAVRAPCGLVRVQDPCPPNLRSAVHPPTALVCWQVRGARRAPMAQILRHHRGGARHAPPVSPADETGGAPTTRPPRATTTQPTHRLLSVHGRRPLDAVLEAVLDGCQAAACGSSVPAGRSSRRPLCPCLGVHRGPGRPALEVRTAVGRRASCPQPPGRSARTHRRARGALEPLGKL